MKATGTRRWLLNARVLSAKWLYVFLFGLAFLHLGGCGGGGDDHPAEAPTAVLEVLDDSGSPLSGNRIAYGQDFILSGSKSVEGNGGSIVRYHWTAVTAPVGVFSGSGTVTTDTSNLTVDAGSTAVPAGSQTYRLQVEDGSGNLSAPVEVQLVIYVPNQPPAPVANAHPMSGFAPLRVDFDASGSSDSDGTIRSYAWDFGDGGTGSGVKVTHNYLASGNYSVALTITDDDGASASIDPKLQVQVLPPPVVEITPASASLEPGEAQQFTARVTGASNTAVAWSLENSDCGSIDANGLFTAGNPPQSCQNLVRAVSLADDRVSATARVSVQTCVNASFTVDETKDVADANPGDKICDIGVGKCSLRAAIEEANACLGPNTVNVPGGIYLLTLGQLRVTDDLTVIGEGAGNTIVDAFARSLVFSISSEVSSATLEGMTLRNGMGGGVHTGANQTTIRNALITHNTAPGDSWGGGVDAWKAGATTVVENSEITFNKAAHAGAIKFSNNNLVLRGTTVSNNYTDDSRYGAIVDWSNQPSSLVIENSTIAGNEGTGITLFEARASITNATITGATDGAGIRSERNSVVTVTNSILYGNSRNCESGGNIGGSIVSGGHNIEARNTCGFAAAGDLINTNPMLGPLADNGGPTRTRGLQPGSPAIDAGDDVACMASDQRGVARPSGSSCDIGAYEDDGTVLAATCLPPLMVTSTLDTVDAEIGDGLCDDGAGNCTLRAAIQEANACVGADLIDLPAGSYPLTLAGIGENATATGDLDVTDDLVINGAGAAATIIDASAPFDDRIFHVLNNVTTAFDGLTLQGVNIDWNVPGGGIATNGNITVSNTRISGNTAGSGAAIYAGATGTVVAIAHSDLSNNSSAERGGAVYVAGMLNASGSTFSGNTAGNYGGAIYGHNGARLNIEGSVVDGNGGTWAAIVGMDNAIIDITDSTVSNSVPTNDSTRGVTGWSDSTINITRSTISGNEGGISSTGAYQYGGGSVLNITDSTISGNSTNTTGGGVYTDGLFTITGSTLSGNTGWDGAGICIVGSGTITNSTISGNSNNSVNGRGGGIGCSGVVTLLNSTVAGNNSQFGGGIGLTNGTLIIGNSIVANNSTDCDLGGGMIVTSNGHNIERQDTCGLADATDRAGINPLLSPLADHGGPTQTHALSLNPPSPAIDAGDDTTCPATDQRGVSRPQAAHCDIGAYEAQ